MWYSYWIQCWLQIANKAIIQNLMTNRPEMVKIDKKNEPEIALFDPFSQKRYSKVLNKPKITFVDHLSHGKTQK